MRWLFSKFKSLIKWIAIGVGTLLVILLVVAIFAGDDQDQPSSPSSEEPAVEKNQEDSSQTNKSQTTEKEKETNQAEPVGYEIVEQKDVSIMYDGEIAKRMKYRVVVGTSIKRAQVEPTVKEIVTDITSKNEEIDSIHLLLYSTESRTDGMYDVAMAEWAPGGEVGNLTGRIAEQNLRDNYEIDLEIQEDLEDYLNQITKQEENFGFTEQKRKEIFRELVSCEDEGDIRSAKYYDPMCQDCPEYRETENWVTNMAKKSSEIIKKCEAKVRQEYGITEDQQEEISIEGMEENWPMPEVPPYPYCCDY